MRHGHRKIYKKARFWRHARRIVAYVAEHVDELELDARDDPYNHGTGELAVGVKEIVDKIVTHCKSVELKDEAGRWPRMGPWAH